MTTPPDPGYSGAPDPIQPAAPLGDPYQQSGYQGYPAPEYGASGYDQGGYYGQQGYPPPAPGYQGGYYPPNPNAKSKIAAGILGILLGAFGVHNFYLGRTGTAIAQLLITVLSIGLLSPVSAIWGLVEGILILSAKPGTKWAYDAHGVPLE
ncbi:MAG: TM2 domain-containing protein [Propionibacteriaceae bacterium]|jgi:TM2 domain-containing membrane protein YozV|nr:TM2 domain-containing protein [Propionibacteriaceae bacterium]